MCNLYSLTKSQDAIRQWVQAMEDSTGNMPPLPGIYPDYAAPIVRNGTAGRALAMAPITSMRRTCFLTRVPSESTNRIDVPGRPLEISRSTERRVPRPARPTRGSPSRPW